MSIRKSGRGGGYPLLVEILEERDRVVAFCEKHAIKEGDGYSDKLLDMANRVLGEIDSGRFKSSRDHKKAVKRKRASIRGG